MKPTTPTGKILKATVSRPVVIPMVFVRVFEGDYVKAALLAQLVYWSDKGHDPDGWIHKKHKEWEEELFLSEYQVRRVVTDISTLGFLSYKVKKVDGVPTAHYLLDIDALSNWINSTLENSSLPGNPKVSGIQETENFEVSSLYNQSLLTERTFIAPVENSEDLPSEEKPTPSEPEEERAITITREDLSPEDPIEVFVKNSLSRHCRVNPKLNTRAGLQMVGRLCEAQDRWGAQEFRTAFLAWCQSTDDYLKKNKYPLNHFLKHVADYLDTPVISARAEAPAASLSIPGHRTVVIDPVVTTDRPSGPEMASMWDRIVTSRLHPSDEPVKVPSTSGFTREVWNNVCNEAKRLIDMDPVKFSYITLLWSLRHGDNGHNWRRLANREFECMATGETSKNRGSGVGDRVVEKYRKLAEEARKKKEEDDEDAV